ncbi:MAG: cbb3-type cytochrome c oxidase subunit 3 [Alphaproteobacteria bacterium]
MAEFFDTLSFHARDYWGAWLMLLFLSVIVFAYHPKNKSRMEEHGNIPLNDDRHPDAED